MLFGLVPVALAGVLFFAAMTVLCLPALWRRREAVVAVLRIGGAITGIAMVLWLVYVEALRVHAICLWCTAVHVIAFALFVAVMAATLWEPFEQD
jgi:uncharacterized membrane protein